MVIIIIIILAYACQRPGALQSMGLQRVRHDLATEQQQIFPVLLSNSIFFLLAVLPQHVGSLVPQPQTESEPPAMEAWSLNLWTTREILQALF